MDPQTQLYFSNIANRSDNYKKLHSLCQDIQKSWFHDCDETDSMKEIIELIDGILIMTSLEDYFLNDKNDLDYFMGEFSKEVISNILIQPAVYGENGDEIALDVIYHFIKLFMKFHKNKEYAPLFEKIRKIFSKDNFYTNYLFNPNSNAFKKEINPKKKNTYEQFNEEFCKDFKKDVKNDQSSFSIGDKVDVLIQYNGARLSLDRNAWVRGVISDIKDNEYIIDYPNKLSYDNTIKYPKNSPNVLKEGTKTQDWEWRLSLKENDIIDCFDRSRWYPSTICEVKEYKNDKGMIYKEYKVGFRLYQDNFLDNNKYDYDTFLKCTIFWDNNENLVDSKGKSYYGDTENIDEYLAFYSKRIQKFQKISSIQREILSNQYNNLLNSYNNNMNSDNNNMLFMNQKNEGEEKIKLINELLENDQNAINIDEFYLYEKGGNKNYILGKNEEKFSYYFALILKRMADDGYFEEMINILKEKPTLEEVYNIFEILMNCTSYLHKEFLKENYEIFKKAFFDMMDSLSAKEMRNYQKEITELASNFFIKINYKLSSNHSIPQTNMDEINLVLSFKMIKSSIFDKKIQGLKTIGEFIKNYSNEEDKKNIINLIKKNDIIKELFGNNYHTQIISKSNDILEFMLKNNEISEEEIKLIWSLTEQGDLEAKMTIIKLLSDLITNINEKDSNIILECIKKGKDKKLNENEIELIYNLSIKGNNEYFMLKSCEYFCKNVLEINSRNNLEKSHNIGKLINFFFKGEKYSQIEIDIFQNDLKLNKNVLPIFYLLDKIVEKYKKNIVINSENNETINNNDDFINKSIHKLIDNDNLLNLFKDNFLFYKDLAKEKAKSCKTEKDLIIDGFSHEDNMKFRVSFLIKSIHILYPKFEFFDLLKEICLNEPIFQSDKLFFYEFMKKFISERGNSESSKEQKIAIETQLFNMLTEENKNEINSSQYNLYIEIFLGINSIKDLLSFNKNANDEYIISINYDVNIDNIFGIDKLWDLLFHLKNEKLIQKLINLIYELYKSKEEIPKLMDKCINILKNEENIAYTKLEKCIAILQYIILESEKSGFIQIKSHKNLLKECIINIPLEIKKNRNNTDIMNLFNSSEEKNNKNKEIDLVYGNTLLMELKQIISEKHNLVEKTVNVTYSYKENGSLKTKILDSSYNNKSLKEILKLDEEKLNNQNIISPNRFIFSGEKIEKEFFKWNNQINPEFEKMIKEWFYFFSKGNELMDKDSIMNYISYITSNQNVDENNSDYIKFCHKCDKDEKGFILEEEFIEYFSELARFHPEKMKQKIKAMKYREDFKKIDESSSKENINNNNLPRYILGNDQQFHNTLIKLFSKFEQKLPIYEFLFLLYTNEKEYNELLDNFSKLFKEDNNSNYLEQLYELIIIESFIQDIEINLINLNEIFKENKNKSNNNKKEKINYKIISKNYNPFDDENNLIKKKLFLINFIENGEYCKLIKYIENLLDSINNNDMDEDKIKFKCCLRGLKIINSIYNSFLDKNLFKKSNNSNDNFYYLGNNLNLNMINDEDNSENENDKKLINKLKEIISHIPYLNLIKKIIYFLGKSQNILNIQFISNYCFDLLINLITSNESLLNEIKKDDYIKENIKLFIKNDIISSNNKEKFFLKSLIKFIDNQLSNQNKLVLEFLIYLFEISNSIFKELITGENQKKDEINSNSYFIFFEYFSKLFKFILNNNNNNNINRNLNNEFVSQIYDLLYKDLKESNQTNKLPEDTFLGFMKILITAIKTDPQMKKEIIFKTINNETLFEIIYNIILEEKSINNQINEKNNDKAEIENLEKILDNDLTNKKYVKMENLDEAIKFSKNKRQNKNEISQKVYDIFNDFIIICLNDSTDPEFIIKLLKLINSKNRINYCQQNNLNKQKKPKAFNHVGLKNIGCICYLNSILQQMYMVPSFRYAIMSADDEKNKNMQQSFFHNNIYDDNLLHQLQKMYTYLTYSEKQAYNPKDFCASFKDFDGAPINPLLQQDSQEFFNNFCDKIEESLKNTKYKYIIDNIFTGKTCSSVTCEKCNTVSNRFEDFYNLTLEVKNIGNLYDSLQKLIEPERIEQFNCEVCQKKVTINKRTSLAKLPNVLFVHLKRFYMNYEVERTEKINSKFEFPNTLDLKQFCIEEILKNNNKGNLDESDEIYPKEDEYYQYELKGINVHLGNAQGGHYISFIDVERDGNNNEPNIKSSIQNDIIKSKWLKFNDSIVTEFDTKDIPVECYGGFVDNNLNNENIQNAYLLIYERKKKTPIKIIVDRENINYFSNKDKYIYNNNIISFGKEQKSCINKHYDISYSNKDLRVKEEELYKIIFCEEETKECYSYIPYYNIEKTVLKETFIEVMKKNMKFLNKKNMPIDNIKYKVECNDILLKIISLQDFNILNKKFSIKNQKQMISVFNEQIFDNKIFKNNSLIIEEEQKIIINYHTTNLLEKLILPIVKNENKDEEEIDDLIDFIRKIFLNNDNLEKIFENKSICRVFDIKNIKIMADIIYSLFIIYNNKKEDLRGYFNMIYRIMDNSNDEVCNFIYNNGNDNYKENNKKENEINSPLYYLYELIYKILLKVNSLIGFLINQQQISNLLGKINSTDSIEKRNFIYNIITYLIEHCYDYTRNKEEGNHMYSHEKEMIKEKAYKNEKLIKKLFDEKIDLLIKLIKIIQYKEESYSNNFNQEITPFLFNYAVSNNKLTQLLDLLYEIININDDYILNRLYYIMGIPEIIIKHQIKEEEDMENDENEFKDNEKENKKFWPLFGCRLLDKSKNGEIYKYINSNKAHENHCILAKLFPCTNDELYENPSSCKNEQKLTEEERKQYIYKLLCISLLNEGNYSLFKYIYLTQSRFIVKYKNLYEEILDILSKDNKYDLDEIKKNAEICIKRINFETNKIKDSLFKKSKNNLEESEDNDKDKEKDEKEENKDAPELPEKMKKHYKKNKNIEEFTGFIPNQLPDLIEKVVYSLLENGGKVFFVCAKYYTTFKEIESLREEIDDKKDIPDKEKDIKNKEEEENKNNINYEVDDDDLFEAGNECDVNKIQISEKLFLSKAYSTFRQHSKIIIKDKFFKNDKEVKLFLVRYILFSKYSHKIFLKTILNRRNLSSEIGYNSFTGNYYYSCIKSKDYADILRVYRRNKTLDFIKERSLNMSISLTEVNSNSEDNNIRWIDSD